jgi:hypothetical protein
METADDRREHATIGLCTRKLPMTHVGFSTTSLAYRIQVRDLGREADGCDCKLNDSPARTKDDGCSPFGVFSVPPRHLPENTREEALLHRHDSRKDRDVPVPDRDSLIPDDFEPIAVDDEGVASHF